MNSLTTAVQSFLEREEIGFEHTEYAGVFSVGFIGEYGHFEASITIDEDKGTVRVWTLAPLVVPRGKRLQAAELLTRINQCLAIGILELDMDDGAVACRTSIILDESDLHHDIMKHLLHANWYAIDTFFPAINAVVFGNMLPKQAFDRARRQLAQLDDSDEEEHGRPRGEWLRDILGGSMN